MCRSSLYIDQHFCLLFWTYLFQHWISLHRYSYIYKYSIQCPTACSSEHEHRSPINRLFRFSIVFISHEIKITIANASVYEFIANMIQLKNKWTEADCKNNSNHILNDSLQSTVFIFSFSAFLYILVLAFINLDLFELVIYSSAGKLNYWVKISTYDAYCWMSSRLEIHVLLW